MKKILLSCTLLCTLTGILVSTAENRSSIAGNTVFQSFSKTKRLLHRIVFNGKRKTLYCNCDYDSKKRINFKSCGYRYRKNKKRAQRVEWEHVVPAYVLGHTLKEWRVGDKRCITGRGKRYKGRRCAAKVNTQYRYMQADMYNLFPAVGEINGDRKNFPVAIIPGETRKYGKCDCEISGNHIEPRPSIRGDIARTYMYMDRAYPGRNIITRENSDLLKRWNRLDPVDKWECERIRRIAKLQKNVNEIVERACKERNY